MIEFPRDSQDRIPTSSVKILGLGGAGANMLDRVALDGIEGAELLALNTDIRTLSGSVASERIQLGRNLTKGLGTGGDPKLGHQAMLEAEDEMRAAVKGRKIVFICVGLGGGTGSGGAPIAARVARQEGAFVVMFATMPFAFEGSRRREQAETALNELAVLSNALVTFDNNRMGELVLAKQGIHEAFAAADRMISESIKAVIRLVVRPGLINIGLDDLMSALRTTRSRCLFGSGLARGKDRAQKALRNALASPLLDQGSLLEEAQSVLVHLCGGEDLTLFEIELLMESLGKHVPKQAQVLFGAAVDAGMEDQLSITVISALPEERLGAGEDEGDAAESTSEALDPSIGFTDFEASDDEPEMASLPASDEPPMMDPSADQSFVETPVDEPDVRPDPFEALDEPSDEVEPESAEDVAEPDDSPFKQAEPESNEAEQSDHPADEPAAIDEPFTEPSVAGSRVEKPDEAPFAESDTPGKTKLPPIKKPTSEPATPEHQDPFAEGSGDLFKKSSGTGGVQAELSFDGGPKGRFQGDDSGVVDGEDLDVPAFLRKKKKP